ncbi:MAG: agmatine deiminase family protein [Coprobacter sp.]|nr:agmatine deiminase family protein [Coprobacter sp.]
MSHYILPAEWYPQSGVQLTWPHAETDWNYMLPEVEECFSNIAREISLREKLLIVAPAPDEVRQYLTNKVNMANVQFVTCPTNDTWARDHGGITMCDTETGKARILDFKFNGWGMKFVAALDNMITRNCYNQGVFEAEYVNKLNFVIEGGSIESDGNGTLLTTSECLLSPNRNGEWDKDEIESYLKSTLSVRQILWLDHGYLAGDDTDSHVDTLARICPNDTIVYVHCTDTDDEHYDALTRMEEQLLTFRTLTGKKYNLLPLPMANAIYEDGERLPATYANFLIINGAILYPTYNQPSNDCEAARVLQQAFPGYEIIGIDCRALIKQHGSLHCVTMQYPQGVLL